MSPMSLEIPTVFDYNGKQFEFDFRDADNAERYEDAIKKMESEEKELEKEGSASVIIRGQCAFLKRFFDRVLGDGAGKAICGERDNLMCCYNAYDAFLSFVREQSKSMLEYKNSFGKYSNRQQRRHPPKK